MVDTICWNVEAKVIVRIETDNYRALSGLEHEAAKVALEAGEEWRLRHPEFMDALQCAGEALRPLPVYEDGGES